FADQHGFAAVWTPERHFHAFGGLYPSPSVVSGALAVLTERIQLRAGSVVLPLHHPVRVAEEWAVVDNLSRGRVGLSLASGWHADDFVLAPEQYANRHQVLEQSLDTLKRLWRGEEVLMPNGVGHEIAVRTLPRPVQADVPIWITSAGSPQTFEKAGELGANVLTHLLGQSLEELQDKIAIYRAALQKHGHDPKAGQVALMLHTFVGADQATVRETVRQPFLNYLKSSFGLVENMVKSARPDLQLQDLSAEDLDDLMAMSFDRYFETSGLFGTPDSCVDMIARLKAIGVDEVACLIDFGVDQATVRESLVHLNELRGRCVRTEDEAPAALTLAQQAERHRPTMMQCTPSMMRLVLADKEVTASLQGVKRFLLGGEALPAQVAAEVHDTFVAQLLNMYGPTETTIWSAVHHVQAEELPIPIGRPIANTQLYILDRHLQELPVGVPGQLYIGGTGVTRGYHNRPELTAERYLSHPIADRGQKLYQTGDVAKRLADGTIVLLGRDDQQVKLNGYRIELGEIEAVLTSHPAVREAVAVVKADDTGGKQLLLYAVLAEGQTLNEEAARRFLKEKLPSYFLPSALVFVDKMPLTPNGKVDRQALLGIKPLKAQAAQYQPPRTPIEETVCAIWADVLEVERVGIADDFFELGGHSLLITKLLMRIRDVFGLELPLRALFQSRTPAALADIIVEQQLVQADDDLLDRLLAELEEV
ncbi:MAG: MupA/Atu3671 family FMN-dependent luciferase-like monooxygenase, partial [Tumebacillaceae bacterium]